MAALLLTRNSRRTTRPLRIDELNGRVGRMSLGASKSDVVAVLGRPGSTDSPFAPLGTTLVDVGGPPAIAVAGRPQILRYDQVAVLLVHGRVFSILVDDPRARTRRGVRVGDPLATARAAYRTLVCRRAPAGESSAEEAAYPFCSARLRGVRVGIGRDPIRSITLTTSSP